MSFGETILRKYGWTQGKQNNNYFKNTCSFYPVVCNHFCLYVFTKHLVHYTMSCKRCACTLACILSVGSNLSAFAGLGIVN